MFSYINLQLSSKFSFLSKQTDKKDNVWSHTRIKHPHTPSYCINKAPHPTIQKERKNDKVE